MHKGRCFIQIVIMIWSMVLRDASYNIAHSYVISDKKRDKEMLNEC